MTKKSFFQGSVLFDYVAVLLSLLLVIGAYTDAWAHHHVPDLETFFTPWHAVLYGSFALNAIFFVGVACINFFKGCKKLSEIVPQGYLLSLLGVGIFLFGGIGDMLWHIAFGIEKDIDALYSPTHLILAGGAFLIVSGAFRAAFHMVEHKTFFQKLPLILSLTFMLSVLTFMTQASHPFVEVYAGNHLFTQNARAFEDEHARGIESIMLQSAILMGVVFYAVKRTKLPAGAFTILLTINAAFLSVLEDRLFFIPLLFAAGIIIDIVYAYLRPNVDRIVQMRWFGFLTPTIIYLFYFAFVLMTEGTHWTVHMVTGSIVLAGLSGWLLSFPSFASTTDRQS